MANNQSDTIPTKEYKIFEAIYHDNIKALVDSIGKGGNPNYIDVKSGTTPLLTAVMSDKPELVKALLELGADPNLVDPQSGSSPLAFSLTDPISEKTVQYLLEYGADPFWNYPDVDESDTLVKMSRLTNNDNIVKMIMSAMAGKNAQILAAKTPPQHVATHEEPIAFGEQEFGTIAPNLKSGRLGEMAMALELIAHASVMGLIDSKYWQKLSSSAKSGLAKSGASPSELSEALDSLESKWTGHFKFDPNLKGVDEAGTVYDKACYSGDHEQAAFWSGVLGADWNPNGGLPALSWAIRGGQNKTVDLLLSLGADPNGKRVANAKQTDQGRFDNSLDAPIQIALVKENTSAVLSLLKAGARAIGTDRTSFSAIRKNIDESQRRAVVDSIGALLENLDISIAARAVGAFGALDAHGWLKEKDFSDYLPAARGAFERFGTDWIDACQNELNHIVHIPIEFIPTFSESSKNQPYSGSILDRACATVRPSAADFISLCAGGNWNPDGDDRPIDWAANVGDAKSIEILVKNGAVLDNDKGVSPLHGAIAGGWAEASRYLIEYGADPSCLSLDERAAAFELLGNDRIDSIFSLGVEMAQSADPEDSFYGLRQVLNLAKVEWISDWAKATEALDGLGFAPHLEKIKTGNTQFGDSILREGGFIDAAADAANPLGGNSSILALYAFKGDVDATRFLSRVLGANFRIENDNGSPLSNAVSGNQIDAARLLISLGADVNGTPSPLALAAKSKNTDLFSMLAIQCASPDGLSDSEFEAVEPLFKANKAIQKSIASTICMLPLEQDGFDRLLVEGSLPSSFAAALVKGGQKERFWNLRTSIDWTSDASELIEAAKADKEAGLAAYARFRRALAGDDIAEAIEAVESTPAMLSSLSKRGLVDEAIMASLGAGRSKLMKAMSQAEWPMESTMREHAAEALQQAAASKDASMFEHLLPMAPGDGALKLQDQEAIARAAWKLGGAAMLLSFDEQIGGVDPSAIDRCRDLFNGVEGEKAFAALAVSGIIREATRSRALDKQTERSVRRKSLFNLASSHWSSLSDDQKLSAATGISSWNESGFWASAARKISAATTRANPASDGAEAFFAYCFQDRATARAVFASAKEASAHELAKAAQMAAATSNDADLATLATVEAGIPSSEEAILKAARLDNTNALKVLLSRVDGSSIKGLLSKALIPSEAKDRAAFFEPNLPNFELPASSCRELADAGATFAKADLEGDGSRLISELAKRAQGDKISAERERSFSTLALRGALPENLWLPKSKIMVREPRLLAWASDEDKNNEEIVIAAVSADGMALSLAGPMARATLSVAKAACAQTTDAVHAVSPSLVQSLALNEGNCRDKLSEAADAAESSFNPLKMLKKKAALSAQKTAQDIAQGEMERSAKARALDFTPLERAIADARLKDPERGMAEMALTHSKAIRSAFERSGGVSNLDLNDLRRIIEKNLPDLLGKFASTDPALRDSYDESSRSTPNKMLRSGLADALIAMENIAARADDGARMGLKGESVVLGGKASSASILAERRAKGAAEAESEDSALQGLGDHIGSFMGVASVSSPANDNKPSNNKPKF